MTRGFQFLLWTRCVFLLKLKQIHYIAEEWIKKTRCCEDGTQFGNSYLKETTGSMFLRSFSRLRSVKDWCDSLIAPNRSNIDPLSLTEQTQHIIACSLTLLSDLLFLKWRRSLEFFPQRVVFQRSSRQWHWLGDSVISCFVVQLMKVWILCKLANLMEARPRTKFQNTNVIYIR